MPSQAKTLDNMDKHLTEAERAARAAAEEGVMPKREKTELKVPTVVNQDARAKKYWDSILKRMDGLAILDDLDSEMLAGYVLMLSRRDRLAKINQELMAQAKAKKDLEAMLEAVDKLDSLTGKLQALERNLMNYAEKLGLTPSGRVRLAQKRARAAEEETDPDADLFGD